MRTVWAESEGRRRLYLIDDGCDFIEPVKLYLDHLTALEKSPNTLGLFFHYFIAISMSVAYYLVARHWAALREKPGSCGAAYGVVLYGVMNYIVVPLSAARGGSGGALWIALSILVHMFLIGVPIALFARRAFGTVEPAEQLDHV
jgi:hypothetical protein